MKGEHTSLTDEQIVELAAPAELPDDQIDTTDIPETTIWSGGRRGAFYRPSGQVADPPEAERRHT